MFIPVIPQELVDAVIDQVYENLAGQNDQRQTLGSCSLVSKSWLPRSRSLLFRRVSLEPSRSGRSTQFIDLLDCPHSTISRYVKILALEYYRLSKILPRLASLDELECLELRLVKCSSSIGSVSFRKIRILKINGSFDRYADISDIVSVCPSLRQLDIIGSDIVLPGGTTNPLPSSLKYVDLSAVHRDSILMWLVSGDQLPPIETFKLSRYFGSSKAITRCLTAFSPSLKNLSFDVCGEDIQDIDLPHLSQLCSVHFGADVFCPLVWGPEYRSRYVLRLLAQITSPEIQEVGFAFKALSVDEMGGVEWNEMAHILERPNFSGLQRVSILGLDGDIKEMQAWILQRLPRGIMRETVVCQKYLLPAPYFD